MARIEEGRFEELSPHKRYAMISEKAYFLGEERRRRQEPDDPAADWMLAEAFIDNLIGFGAF